MNRTNLLKIEKNGQVVLLTEQAHQSMYWNTQMLNINNEPINLNNSENIEITCEIITETTPNIDLLFINDIYSIYSILYFKFSKLPDGKYIQESIIHKTKVRPILELHLTNFSCTNGKWKLNFKNNIMSKVECIL